MLQKHSQISNITQRGVQPLCCSLQKQLKHYQRMFIPSCSSSLLFFQILTSAQHFFAFTCFYFFLLSFTQIYFTFVGISTDIYLAFLLIMTASTLSVRSFVSSSLVLLACLLALALFMPLIIMIVSTILVVSISISLASILVQSASAAFWDNFDTRTWLTAVADRIPPSVGRVEVSHEKQRKDHEALTAAKTINP